MTLRFVLILLLIAPLLCPADSSQSNKASSFGSDIDLIILDNDQESFHLFDYPLDKNLSKIQ